MTKLPVGLAHVDVWNHLTSANWNTTLFRLPDSPRTILMSAPHTVAGDPTIVGADRGFALQSFDGKSGRVIPAEYYAEFEAGELVLEFGNKPNGSRSLMSLGHSNPSGSGESFGERVYRATRELIEGVADKVVLSHRLRQLGHFGDPVLFLDRLMKRYPTSFCCATWTPEFGLWIGASPELLVSWEGGRTVRTMALAGTRKMPESGDPADATWTAKEIEEHAFVVRDIIERFKEIRLREYEEFGPKAVAAGPVVHLKTDFVMDAILTDRASLADDLRQRLHPTSAVCGTPKRAAQELISRLESHDRQLYTGYWGPIGLDGGARLFVNLRCLRWFDNAVELYVGAGITRSSKPDREEEEIRLKANTLLSVLFESA